ncbi:MAG: arginine--tRNA ligase [Planctomycetes bacterium]|nr:arginine--tRNA ligase [Planctomycetota bacterium]
MSLHRELERRILDAAARAFGEEYREREAMLKRCQNPQFGDFQCNLALPLAKQVGEKPRDAATQLMSALEVDDLCSAVEIAGPGFLNLRVRNDVLGETIAQTLLHERCGVDARESRRVVLDYSSPNLAKDLHVGTFRTTVIGDTIARVFTFLGHTVLRQNHYGDWGTNFGVLVAMLRREFAGDLERLKELSLEDVEALYTKASALRKEDVDFAKTASEEARALQEGDPASMDAWKRLMDVTLSNAQEIYRLLDVTLYPEHDRAESSYRHDLQGVIDHLEACGILAESQGAQCVYLEGYENQDGTPLPAIVRKRDGGFNYTTTDLAAMRHRVQDLKADRIIIVTDRGQSLHFEMLAKVALKAGFLTEDVTFTHLGYGVILKEVEVDGKKKKERFKTRTGGTVKIRDLVAEARERCKQIAREKNPDHTEEELDELALRLAIAGLKYGDLKQRPESDYVFDWDQMLNTQGDSGIYLMYAYVRVASLFEKAGVTAEDVRAMEGPLRTEEPAERELALHLAAFPEVFRDYEQDLAANVLCRYLYDLATLYSRFWHDCPVLKADEPARSSRLRLSLGVAQRMHLGLSLLGIQTVDRM